MTTNRMKDISGFGPIVIDKKRVCTTSWWIGQPQQHFTKVCAQETHTVIPADDVSDRDVQAWQRRSAVLALVQETAARVLRATA